MPTRPVERWPESVLASDGSSFELAFASDVGTERARNEDYCGHALHTDCAVLALADGVSGWQGGETASKLAVETTLRAFAEQSPNLSVHKRLYRAVQQANIAVYELSVVVPELAGMSTTLTAVAISGTELAACHVGDTRLYLLRQGKLTQLTKDHTVVARRVRLGLLSAERARVHPKRSILTRSLGRDLLVAVDRISRPVREGDVLIVCSDGLYNVLAQDEIRASVESESASDATRSLVALGNRRGTPDNLTLGIFRLLHAPPAPAPQSIAARLRKYLP